MNQAKHRDLRSVAQRYAAVASLSAKDGIPMGAFGLEVTENEREVIRFAYANELHPGRLIHLIYLAHKRREDMEEARNEGRVDSADQANRTSIEMRLVAKDLGVTIDFDDLWCRITVRDKPECLLPTLF